MLPHVTSAISTLQPSAIECLQGTLVASGHGKGVVIGTGEQSAFGEVVKMMKEEVCPPAITAQQSGLHSTRSLATDLRLVHCWVLEVMLLYQQMS